MNSWIVRVLAVCIFLVTIAGTCLAQSGLVYAEVGTIADKYGSSINNQGLLYGGGAQLQIGGKTDKSSGWLIPVGFDLRGGSNQNSFDALAHVDLAIRIKNVSFGPGMNFGYVSRPLVNDPVCKSSVAIIPGTTSSCIASSETDYGKRYIGNLFELGYSGFGKVTFGPRQRIFIQSRFIYMDKNISSLSAKFLNGDATDIPALNKGYEIRTSAGYVFNRWFIRAQYAYKKMDFKSELANKTGIFNQNTNTTSMGVGIIF